MRQYQDFRVKVMVLEKLNQYKENSNLFKMELMHRYSFSDLSHLETLYHKTIQIYYYIIKILTF